MKQGTSTTKKQTFLGKLATIGAFIAIGALFFSGCEVATSNGGDPSLPAGVASRLASRAKVGQPTPISDQQELADIDFAPAGDYILVNDITLVDWIPICGPDTSSTPFTGNLDGAGYTITISSFDLSGVTDYLGIFAQAEGAGFSNLTVDIAAGVVGPTDATDVGGLVADATGTLFDGINVTGVLDIGSPNTGNSLNAGLVAGSAKEGSIFTDTGITANLTVKYASTDTTSVNAGGIAGSLVDSDVYGAGVNGQFTINTNMPYDYFAGNGAQVGGVAGYAGQAVIEDVIVGSRTVVNAVSAQTPVYAAGVVGRGLTVTITDNESAAAVTGNGPGYSTSGGGVGGYIVHSTVTNSSASGEITLSGDWDGTVNTLWQIYAGGLVGYSGGNSGGNSVITSSGASGKVTATAPYPYAGGLVGYNYGYIEFTSLQARWDYYHGKTVQASVTSNGSQIIRSYATGNATATSTPGSNGLPYAGGLAGYSSIPTASGDPNIEDCYATGNATVTTDSKYGWAGGLLGGNAQGSIVTTSYASGNVSVTVGGNELPYPQDGINPGAAGGGIVGVNYFDDATSGIVPLVAHCVALNGSITGSAPTGIPYLLHRVAGDLGAAGFLGALYDNDALTSIAISPVWDPEIGPDLRDGASIGPAQAAFAGWDFSNVWTTGANGYPALR